MLQKYSVQEQVPQEQGTPFLSPAIILDIFKRRFFYFLIPFVLVFAAGAAVVMLIPAVYSAEGKILVKSQQIPSDLVKPTVSRARQRTHSGHQPAYPDARQPLVDRQQIPAVLRASQTDDRDRNGRLDARKYQDQAGRSQDHAAAPKSEQHHARLHGRLRT